MKRIDGFHAAYIASISRKASSRRALHRDRFLRVVGNVFLVLPLASLWLPVLTGGSVVSALVISPVAILLGVVMRMLIEECRRI